MHWTFHQVFGAAGFKTGCRTYVWKIDWLHQRFSGTAESRKSRFLLLRAQTTAPSFTSFFFSGLIRSAREMPSHMTIGLATSTEE